MTQQLRGSLFVLASAAGFATEAIFVKLAYGAGMTGYGITASRMLLAAVVAGPLFLRYALANAIGIREHIKLLVLGGVFHSTVVILLTLAIEKVDASVAILCFYLYPALTTAFAVPVLGEQASPPKLAALLGALAGVSLVIWSPGTNVDPTGAVLAFSAAMANAILLIAVKKWALHHPPAACSGGMMMYSGIALGVLSIFFRMPALPSGTAIVYIALLATLGTVLPLTLLYKGMSLTEASLASIVSTTEPVMTAALAFAVLGERLGLRQVLGGLIVFVSTLLIGLKKD